MMGLLCGLLLAGGLAAAAPPVAVESPNGRTALEEPPASADAQSRRCDTLAADFKASPAPETLEALFFCLGNSDARVRTHALYEMGSWELIRRPDFGTVFYPKLQKAVALYSLDPDLDVRYAAGGLSRMLQGWQNTESPRALELRRRYERQNGGGEHGLTHLDFAIIGFIFLVFFISTVSSGLQLKRKRKR